MARWTPIERTLRAQYGPLLVGVDEVGRGPLAGPVVACAIVMPPDRRAIAGVDDSKKLDAATRVVLAARIREQALVVSLGAASAREIDRINIYHATVLAMRRALARVPERLGCEPNHVLVDGKPLRTLGMVHTAVVKGDAKCYAIACASRRVLSVLSTPPVIGTPKCTSTISGVLAATTATVSPVRTPALTSADARRRDRA